MGSFVQDLRHAVRSARRQPLLFTVATAVLALAIAASTAVFSVVDAVLLRPLPFADAHRLVLISEREPARGVSFGEVSYPHYLAWRTQTRTLETLAVLSSTNGRVIIAGDEPVQVPGRLVSGNFFDVLGARALLGRTLSPADDQPAAARVAVVSHGLWQRRFGADPDLVGRAVVLDDTPTIVVGVMPPGFGYPPRAEVWAPLVPNAPWGVGNAGLAWTVVLGRLAAGADVEHAQAELDVIVEGVWAAVRAAYPIVDSHRKAAVWPFTAHLFGTARPALLALLGAVLLVVVLACANVCALLLARAAGRQREIALRLALGASRSRLARQLLAESVVIAAAGGLVGVLLATAAVDALVALIPAEVPRLQEVGVDGRVLGFALALTALSALGAGLMPALMASKPSLVEALGETTRLAGHPSHRRARGLLVAGEAAIAVVLLSGAGLLARTFQNLRQVDLGFDPRHLLTLVLSGSSERYPRYQDLYRALLERIDALPGVETSGAVDNRPLLGQIGNDWPFDAEGQPEAERRRNPLVNLQAVTPRYFEAMRIPLLRGRAFTERDDERAPGVAVVSRAMAERCWPGQDALGKRLKIPLPDTTLHDVWLTVVGVVGEVRYRELQAARLDLYLSYRQANHGLSHVMVRSTGDAARLAPAVRAAIRDLDRSLVVSNVRTMEGVVAEAQGGARFGMQLMSAFALCALILAALGTYGVMAFVVGRRTREVGVRMALGARAADVMVLVVREGMWPVVAGLAVGLAGSLALGRALTALLFGVPPHDAETLATATAVLGTVALAACAFPARRASRIDPARALREE